MKVLYVVFDKLLSYCQTLDLFMTLHYSITQLIIPVVNDLKLTKSELSNKT